MIPTVKVVKAFNSLLAARQANPMIEDIQLDCFVATDDAQAKQQVLSPVRSLGFRPVDAGPLAMARAGRHGPAQHFSQHDKQLDLTNRLEAPGADELTICRQRPCTNEPCKKRRATR